MDEIVTWGGLVVSLAVGFYILWRPGSIRRHHSDPTFVKAVAQSLVNGTNTKMDLSKLFERRAQRAKLKRVRG